MARGEQARHELLSRFEDATIDLQHMCRQADVDLARRSGWGLTGAPPVLLTKMDEMAQAITEWIALASRLSVHEAEGAAPGNKGTKAAHEGTARQTAA